MGSGRGRRGGVMERKQRRRLGELLVEGGILTEKQLKTALGYQRYNGGKLAEGIVQLGLAPGLQLMFTLSEQLGIPYRRVGDFKVAEGVARLIPAALIHKHRVLPLATKPAHPRPRLLVAMTDPQDLKVVDDLAFASGYAIVPVLVSV